MDTSQWPQAQVGVGGVVDKSMESSKSVIEKRGVGTIRPQKDQIFYCPRCNSTNTKFCYYNNYSLTQPRYFCKTCRRYWTEGGSLRNVPVGGGSRKNKRSSSTSSPSSSSRNPVSQNPNKFLHGGQDLNLAYPPPNIHEYSIGSFSKYIEVSSNFANGKSVLHRENPNPITTSISSHFPSMELFGSPHQESRGFDNHHPNGGAASISKLIEVPYVFGNDKITPGNPSLSATASPYFAPIELFKNGESNDIANTSSKGEVSSLQEPVSDNSGTIMFSPMGFPMQGFKPSANFSSDEYDNDGGGYGNLHGLQQQQHTNGARVLFPFQDNLKPVSSGSGEQQFDDQNRGQGDSNTGFWKGMVNGGSW